MSYKVFLSTCIFIASFFAEDLVAQNSAYFKSQVYKAYVTGNMNLWLSAISSMESENISGIDKKMELVSYYYGYIGYLVGKKNYDQANKYIAKGDQIIDGVLKSQPKNASAYAFKGSFYGFKLTENKSKILTYGAESVSNIDKALDIDPQNIQAVVDKANILFYAPRLFGGDKQESLKFLQRAVQMMERKGDTHQNWFYLNTLVQMGKVYEALGKYPQALQVYEKVLRIEPDMSRIRTNHIPALKQKM